MYNVPAMCFTAGNHSKMVKQTNEHRSTYILYIIGEQCDEGYKMRTDVEKISRHQWLPTDIFGFQPLAGVCVRDLNRCPLS